MRERIAPSQVLSLSVCFQTSRVSACVHDCACGRAARRARAFQEKLALGGFKRWVLCSLWLIKMHKKGFSWREGATAPLTPSTIGIHPRLGSGVALVACGVPPPRRSA